MSDSGPADEQGERGKDEPVLLGLPQSSLLARLTSGGGSVAEADREAYATANDAQAWQDPRLRQALRRLYSTQVSSSQRPELPGARKALTELFADPDFEHVVRALLHHPEHLLGVVLPELLAPEEGPASPVRVWSVFTVCVETLWEHVSGQEGQAHRHLEPLAARTRFLSLSEPFRHRGSQDWEEWWQQETLQHLFGQSPVWVPLIRRVREAREVWRGYLDRHQSLPLFDHAPPLAMEEEIRWLAFQEPARQRVFFEGRAFRFTVPLYSGGPLALSGPVVQGSGSGRRVTPPPPTAVDRAVLVEVVERHLLPRFAVVAVWSAVLGLYRRPKHRGALAVYGLLLLALANALALVVLALSTDRVTITHSLYGIGALYVITGLGALFLGRVWAMPLLLRLPAAGAVGLIILVAFHPTWWERAAPGWLLPAVLVGAALGYLLVETRNHNTGSTTHDRYAPLLLAGRTLAVAATGLVHSLFVALVGMVTITTVFGEDGDKLLKVWEGTSGDGNPVEILLASTFWCLAAGVFSQILWDDQPITAPLSHRRWRDER
ncbi:hypothetical protein [Nocardiopsis quinghaiensis]|uniref:hypothetical protein n=1 Tax=Nocardiopsis quinghaiensis TaxID=464995 RepID=UPI001239CA67|nr:hypothetical protein [Nocardiopsis quinghaiensis]